MKKQQLNKVKADKIIAFIECLTVPSGEGQGEKFKLREWQKQFIYDVYAPVDNHGIRLARRAILSMARKNGKTTLIAGLVLAHLIGPASIQNGEVYSAANSRDQASQVFKVAAQMVRAAPELYNRLRVIDSTKHITCYGNGSFYKAIAADAGVQHGLNPSMVIFDELAQAKNRDLYDALDTSMGARKEPLFIIISTQSNDPEHILSRLIDDGLNASDDSAVCHLYAVPDTADVFDATQWKKANPALGDFRSLKEFTALAERAKRIPSEENKFRNLYCNQRTSSTASLISRREWQACIGNAKLKPGEDIYLALDLSSVNDLTALAAVSATDKSRVQVFMWKPQEQLKEHSNRDFGHGDHRYDVWAKQGHLLTTPGKVIDHAVVARKVVELCKTYKVRGCAYDRHKIDYFIRALDSIDYPSHKEGDADSGGLKLVPWGQGFVSMGPAIDAFETLVLNRELVHSNNPVLNWNIANAIAVLDAAGNRKLDKDKARFRIDGAQALAMVLGLKARDLQGGVVSDLADFMSGAVMN